THRRARGTQARDRTSARSSGAPQITVDVPGDVRAEVVAVPAVDLVAATAPRQKITDRPRRPAAVGVSDAHIGEDAVLDDDVLARGHQRIEEAQDRQGG